MPDRPGRLSRPVLLSAAIPKVPSVARSGKVGEPGHSKLVEMRRTRHTPGGLCMGRKRQSPETQTQGLARVENATHTWRQVGDAGHRLTYTWGTGD